MGEVRNDDGPRPTMTSRRCDYCGVFEGFKHSADCKLVRMAEILGHKEQELRQDMAKPSLRIVITIPPEVEQYAVEIGRFVEAMVYKLGVHSKKGKWENQTIESRFPKLEGEVEELREAVARGNMVEILLEAADVANYALIIAAKGMEK